MRITSIHIQLKPNSIYLDVDADTKNDIYRWLDHYAPKLIRPVSIYWHGGGAPYVCVSGLDVQQTMLFKLTFSDHICEMPTK